MKPVEVKVLHHSEGDYVPKKAYDKAVKTLKNLARTKTRDPLIVQYRSQVRETLKELGEL